MENATKVLIIAATVLITVLVLSVGVYLFKNYSEFAYENEKRQASQAIIQFNTKFEKYEDKVLTIQDVITIANLAIDFNTRYEDAEIRIDVYLGTQDLLKKLQTDNEWVNQLTKNKEEKYKIKQFDRNSDSTINGIRIEKINY